MAKILVFSIVFEVFICTSNGYSISDFLGNITKHENSTDLDNDYNGSSGTFFGSYFESGYGSTENSSSDENGYGPGENDFDYVSVGVDYFSNLVGDQWANTMEKKWRHFLSELNEMCVLAEFFGIKHVFHKCNPPSKLITLNLDGEKQISVSMRTLTKVKDSKLAKFFENDREARESLPIVDEIPNKIYFVDRKADLSNAVFEFLKSPNYCMSEFENVGPNSLKAELSMYGIKADVPKEDGHYKIVAFKQKGEVCFEWLPKYY